MQNLWWFPEEIILVSVVCFVFFNADNVSLVWEMFNQEETDYGDNVEKQDDSNINELHFISLREF